jgi:hypothetical protein
MKKSEWTYLANAMWSYSEKNEGQISNLLKELIIKINKGEVIIDDNEKIYEIIRSDGVIDSNTTSNTNFEGTGEF